MFLNVVKYPEVGLRKKAKKVKVVDETVKQLVLNMVETMQKSIGVGLAAPQVGVSKRIIVIFWDGDDLVFVNPEIIKRSWRKEIGKEGCLSFGDAQFSVKRNKKIVVRGLDYSGKKVKLETDGWLARIFQHEIDHLDGILIIDRASNKERKKYEKSS